MKKYIRLCLCIGIAATVMTACDNEMPQNKLLGEIPEMSRQRYENREKLLNEQATTTERPERERINQELIDLDKNYTERFQEYMKSGSLNSNLPFEVSGEFPYTVNDVSFQSEKSILKLIFNLTTNETIKKTFSARVSLHFVGLDSKGEPIVFSIMPAASYILKEELPAASALELTGTWDADVLMTLQDFAKVQIITQDRYNELARERNKSVRSY
jgi:hypothetical protein